MRLNPSPFDTTVSLTPFYPFRSVSETPARILYCRCAFAQAVPAATKEAVLERLCESGVNFECVSDLCEMAARKDERLKDLIGSGEPVRIIACYPRAVKWLFHHAGVPFPEENNIEVLNMRDTSAEAICVTLLEDK